MPPPTASQKPTAAKGNGTNGAAPKAAAAATADEHTGKPDQAKYNADQDALNKEIAAVKAKLVSRLEMPRRGALWICCLSLSTAAAVASRGKRQLLPVGVEHYGTSRKHY